MIKRQIFLRVVIVGLALSLSACTNPYDPVQRTIGGGLIGAGSGAAIGAAAGGGHGAASARPSVERWARWAALSLHPRRLATATNLARLRRAKEDIWRIYDRS